MSEIIHVPIKDGTLKQEVVYNVNDDVSLPLAYRTSRKRHGKKNITYLEIVTTFDIETTTIGNGNTGYHAFMYQWQFCINGIVIFGRRWEEFLKLLEKLNDLYELCDTRRLVCYVHNLAYEFQFLKDFMNVQEMFAKDKKKPMYFYANGVEFRCSYFLSNMSLQKFCENSEKCTHYKLGGDEYNYSKMRTCDTELTAYEKGYCFNDVYGLYECILNRLDNDTLSSIPLTSTGYVRRDYRNAMNNRKNRAMFLKLRLNAETYTMCRKAFRGGDTHANRFKVGLIIDEVYSCDKQSSYPATMELYYFPMSPFTPVVPRNQSEFDKFIESDCCLMDVTIYNLVCKPEQGDPYIDLAHCVQFSNIINDNGRILMADMVRIFCTECDIECIRMCYENCFNIKVNRMFIAKRGKLPFELRNHLMQLYKGKTELKGVEGKEYEYAKKKNDVNSSFGMMVSSIDREEILYSNGVGWNKEVPNLEKALDEYYNSRNNFLSYQWGVWITAQSRLQLRYAITLVGKDFVYSDTDSVKFIGKHHLLEFEELNKKIIADCEKAQPRAYAIRDGEKCYLGVWENDGVYKRFRTWGAKKYAYEVVEKKDNPQKSIKKGDITFHITVSGMSKEKGAKAIGCIENFMIDGSPFTDVGRQTAYYNDAQPHYETIDGTRFLTASNIALVDTTYTLGVTSTYRELISENILKLIENSY